MLIMKRYNDLSQIEKGRYTSLLKTVEWHELRNAKFLNANETCVNCGKSKNWDLDTGRGLYLTNIQYYSDTSGIVKYKINYTAVLDPIILHLHHTYYVQKTLPWNYPDSCFEVLCEQCHAKVHKEKTILMFANHTLAESKSLTPCYKCNGSGQIEHYRYYADGVCFQCNGAGFEELQQNLIN